MDSTLGPYTRVTAVTQNMLNHGFKQLYDTYTELSSFDYTDADREWKVSLKLLPTQICIRGPEAIYLRLRIDTGFITVGTDTSQPLDGWTLCHRVESKSLLEPRTSLLRFDVSVVPGDLSPERFLSILLASPSDGLVLDDNLTICKYLDASTLKQVKETWGKWSEKNPDIAAKLTRVFTDWPRKLREKEYNVLGLRFRILQMPSSSSVGVETRRVVLRKQPNPQETTVEEEENGSNSILICSASEEQGTAAAPFDENGFTGNYVVQALSSPDSAGISGYLVLNSREVFDRAILPHMRHVNAASELDVGPAIWSTDQNGNQVYAPVYKVRRDFATLAEDDNSWMLPPPSPLDFVASPGAQEEPKAYTWNRPSETFSVDAPMASQKRDAKGSVTHSSEHSSVVNLTPSNGTAKATFHTIYKTRSKWTLPGESPGQFNFDYHISWHLNLVIAKKEEPTGFSLAVTVLESPSLAAAGNLQTKVENSVVSGFNEIFESRLLRSLGQVVDKSFLPSVLAACKLFISHANQHVRWPMKEREWMEFHNPVLNLLGDLIIGINYRKRPFRDLIEVADLSPPRPRPQPPQPPAPGPVEPTKPSTLRLQWTFSIVFPTGTRDRMQLQLRAQNTTNTKLTSGTVTVLFQSSKQPGSLFSALRFPSPKPPLPPPSDAVTAIEPAGAKAAVEAHKSAVVPNTWKATVTFGELGVGAAVAMNISASTSAQAGQAFVLELSESLKSPVGGGTWVEGSGQLKVVVP